MKLLIISVCTLLMYNASVVRAQNASYIGPMTVGRFKAIEEKLGVAEDPVHAYLSNQYFGSVVNILVGGLLETEGTNFCIPELKKNGSGGQLFYEVAISTLVAIQKGKAEADLYYTALKHLNGNFPCPKI